MGFLVTHFRTCDMLQFRTVHVVGGCVTGLTRFRRRARPQVLSQRRAGGRGSGAYRNTIFEQLQPMPGTGIRTQHDNVEQEHHNLNRGASWKLTYLLLVG